MGDDVTDDAESLRGTPRALLMLHHLSEDRFSDLVAAFDGNHAYTTRAEIRSAAAGALPDASDEERNAILDFALAYAEVARERGKLNDDDYVDGMIRAAKEQLGDKSAVIEQRFRQLLRAPGLQLRVQASDLDRHHRASVRRSARHIALRPGGV